MSIQDLLKVEDAFRAVSQLAARRRKVQLKLRDALAAQQEDTQEVRDLQAEIVQIDAEIQAAADRIEPEITKEAVGV